MASWHEFECQDPDLADAGRRLLYQHRIGLGYLATVRADGGPRVHPFCPVLWDGRLWGLIGNSPKQRDLARDGRYAIHSFPCPDRDDEFYLTGRATARRGDDLVAGVRTAYLATGATSSDDETLFEFDIERVLLATYKKRGEPDNWPPVYRRWPAL